MDRGAAHDPSILFTWNLRSFGRNPRRSKSVGPPKDLRTNGPSRYTIKSNTNEHSNVGSDYTVANSLHSFANGLANRDSHQPTSRGLFISRQESNFRRRQRYFFHLNKFTG